jgi:hypothetical protein
VGNELLHAFSPDKPADGQQNLRIIAKELGFDGALGGGTLLFDVNAPAHH